MRPGVRPRPGPGRRGNRRGRWPRTVPGAACGREPTTHWLHVADGQLEGTMEPAVIIPLEKIHDGLTRSARRRAHAIWRGVGRVRWRADLGRGLHARWRPHRPDLEGVSSTQRGVGAPSRLGPGQGAAGVGRRAPAPGSRGRLGARRPSRSEHPRVSGSTARGDRLGVLPDGRSRVRPGDCHAELLGAASSVPSARSPCVRGTCGTWSPARS
jgi:hypothetical protein